MISASLSLSLPRLGWKSTSTPRSLKICTAAGDRASEMRTRGLLMVYLSVLVCRHRPCKRAIQYADASRLTATSVATGCPAFAGHDADICGSGYAHAALGSAS